MSLADHPGGLSYAGFASGTNVHPPDFTRNHTRGFFEFNVAGCLNSMSEHAGMPAKKNFEAYFY